MSAGRFCRMIKVATGLSLPWHLCERVASACRFVAMLRKDNDLQQATSFFKGLRLPDGALK